MDNNQIFNPGGNAHPVTHSEQIKEEFYKWFESRGLLAELRAHMRQLMVKALEENNVNSKKKWLKKSSTSPKLQAINLLVVDHLFHEDYFYTVSVFASEAHILDSLPQYSRYVTESVQQRRWDPASLPRFSRQETEDILDTLHLPPSTTQVRQAVDSYLTGRESLLACVVRSMVSVPTLSCSNQHSRRTSLQKEVLVEGEGETGSSYQLWSEEMQQLLLMAGLKLTHIQRMRHKWGQIIEYEKKEARKKAEEDFALREEEMQQAVEERLDEERADLQERQSRVEMREESLANLAEQLCAVHKDVSQRLSQLQLQSEQLEERAVQHEHERSTSTLQQLNIDCGLSNEQESVQLDYGNLGSENYIRKENATKESFVQVTEDELGVTVSTQTLNEVAAMSTQTLEVAVVASTQTIETKDYELQTSFDSPDPEHVAQMEQARRKISELQEENVELRAHILQQRQRIDELTNRAANLSSQLEESEIAMTVLRGRDSAVVTTAPSPPPPPLPIAPTFGFQTPQRQGGGEESLFAPRPVQAIPRADSRRRPLRFAFSQQYPNTNSEESSPTDDVIQNARSRIQQLEQESISIQRNFQDLQTRLLTTDSFMFPSLPRQRTSEELLRVRRVERPNWVTGRTYPPFSFDGILRRIPNRQQHEDLEETSSDFYETAGIDSISNSRRLFNQRNIRHYERWKQFKKKFQKQDGQHHIKRKPQEFNRNNTSSEDDDVEIQSPRKNYKNENANNFSTLMSNSQTQPKRNKQKNNELNPNVSLQTRLINEATNTEHVSADGGGLTPLPRTKPQPETSEDIQEPVVNQGMTIACTSKPETGIELDLERSAKLIESVKILLDAQSMKESAATTASSGSLAVESLPRDPANNNSQIDVGKTESSVATVQVVTIRDNADQLNTITNIGLTSTTENCVLNSSTKPKLVHEHQAHTRTDYGETLEKKENDHSKIVKDSILQENHPVKLSSDFPETNYENENLLALNIPGTSDMAEVESVDRATTSLTSGSDILRELNPSKTDSCSSVLSAGFGDNSKHSSDFWE